MITKEVTFYKGAFGNSLRLAVCCGHELMHVLRFNHNKDMLKGILNKKNSSSKLSKFIYEAEKEAESTHEQWVQNFVRNFKSYELKKMNNIEGYKLIIKKE